MRTITFVLFAHTAFASNVARLFETGQLSPEAYIAATIAEAKAHPDSRALVRSASWIPLAVFDWLANDRARFGSFAPVLFRPTMQGEDSLTGGIGHSYTVQPTHFDTDDFRVWYVTTTDDAPSLSDTGGVVGVPDYVEQVGAIMQRALSIFADSLGFRRPVSDTLVVYPAGVDFGGDGRFDVYLLSLPQPYLGYTAPEYLYGDRAATCYMVLDDDYADYSQGADTLLRSTAAHELFHAVQYAYDVFEFASEDGVAEPVWMEMTATFAEELVDPELNQYLSYLPIFFDNPWVSLFAFSNDDDSPHGLHQYASCVFPFFLDARFGDGTVRAVWERCAEQRGDNLFSAIDEALAPHGASFVSAMSEFVEYNVFTGSRHYQLYVSFYHEGELWPELAIDSQQVHSTYPVSVPSAVDPPEPFGCGYASFAVDVWLEGGLRIDFSGSNDSPWGTEVVALAGDFDPFRSSQTGDGPNAFELREWNIYNTIFLAALSLGPEDTRYGYAYTARVDPSLTGMFQYDYGDRVFDPYPNPYVEGESIGGVKFRFSVRDRASARIDVYTLDGRRVWRYESGEFERRAGPYEIAWDTRNESGKPVAAGMYVAHVRVGSAERTVKVAIVR